MLGPTIQTERLILRPPVEADLDGWAEFMADETSARFVGGAMPRAAAWRFMATMAGSWALKGFGMFSVVDRASGRWVGRLGPWAPEGWPGTEVGWGVHPAFQRRGYAVEGSAAAIDWAFDHLGWSEVVHCIAPENAPSKRTAERLGSRLLRSGRLPPPFETLEVEIWGQSREQWRARRAGAGT